MYVVEAHPLYAQCGVVHLAAVLDNSRVTVIPSEAELSAKVS